MSTGSSSRRNGARGPCQFGSIRLAENRAVRRKAVLAARPSVVEDALPDPDLHAALRQLTERQRTVVVLVHGFGYSLREVGELLDIGPTSVQDHMERGLRRLHRQLEER